MNAFVGKTVHYKEGGHLYPAIVTQVWDQGEGEVRLTIFGYEGEAYRKKVPFSPDEKDLHWTPIQKSK